MVKECLVTLNNEVVTVVLFDDKYIQFPAIKRDATTLNICFDDGKYFIVDDDTKIEEPTFKPKKKSAYKKTTVNIEEDLEVENTSEINIEEDNI